MLKAKTFMKSFIFQNFSPMHLSSFLSVFANISGHLTACVTVQVLQVTVFNVLRFVQR
jgi:hypothetical protein